MTQIESEINDISFRVNMFEYYVLVNETNTEVNRTKILRITHSRKKSVSYETINNFTNSA